MIDPKVFAAAMRDYFNVQTNAATFMGELKKLTDEDKFWFQKELERVGYIFAPYWASGTDELALRR